MHYECVSGFNRRRLAANFSLLTLSAHAQRVSCVCSPSSDWNTSTSSGRCDPVFKLLQFLNKAFVRSI